MNRIYI